MMRRCNPRSPFVGDGTGLLRFSTAAAILIAANAGCGQFPLRPCSPGAARGRSSIGDISRALPEVPDSDQERRRNRNMPQ